MKGLPVDKLVHAQMFPAARASDPMNFHILLQRSLIPEVRQETQAFYGHLDTEEAKYPGLDYTHPTHRIRLSRWPWHRRLFRAFDALGLTDAEIAGLTKWEGTRWAKENFEKEQGVPIRDTTADGIPDASEVADYKTENPRPLPTVAHGDSEGNDEAEDELDSDGELESVGLELNQRLRVQAARRAAGDSSAVLDEEWEQWLKNAIESGQLSFLPRINTNVPPGLPAMLNAARAGNWNGIPEFLHNAVRRAISEADGPLNSSSSNSAHRDPESSSPRLESDSGAPMLPLYREYRASPLRREIFEDARVSALWPTASSDLHQESESRSTGASGTA